MAKMLLSQCIRCPLHKNRTQVVKGRGNRDANLMFLGEAPGQQEDEHGIPFYPKAPAGKVLTKHINSLNMKRKDVWITNVCKCRPLKNRNPFANEINSCYPWLRKELIIIRPGIIVALGGVALFAMTGRNTISKNRGKFLMLPELIPPTDGKDVSQGIYLMVTYHPAALCYGSSDSRKEKKQAMIDDFKMLGEWYFNRKLPEIEIAESRIWS